MVNRLLRHLGFAAEVEQRAAKHETVRKLKEQLEKQGYKYAMSWYGNVKKNYTGHTEYRRIEVLRQTPFTETWIYELDDLFTYIIPQDEYTLWVLTPLDKLSRRYPPQ